MMKPYAFLLLSSLACSIGYSINNYTPTPTEVSNPNLQTFTGLIISAQCNTADCYIMSNDDSYRLGDTIPLPPTTHDHYQEIDFYGPWTNDYSAMTLAIKDPKGITICNYEINNKYAYNNKLYPLPSSSNYVCVAKDMNRLYFRIKNSRSSQLFRANKP